MGNVIIIGGSGEILKHEKGKKIDAFDYVVRMGDSKVRGYEKYVGTKTDMFRVGWKNHFYLKVNNDYSETFCFVDTELAGFTDLLITRIFDPDDYKETSSVMQFSVNKQFSTLVPVWKREARSPFAQTHMHPRISHDFCLEMFKQYHQTIKNVQYYSQQRKAYISGILKRHDPKIHKYPLPTNGILTIDHIITTRPQDNIYITGFDGLKTRYYWRDHDTFSHQHNSVGEQLLLKRLIKTGRIIPL